MERSRSVLSRSLLLLSVGMLLAFIALPTLADPPGRAARISLVSGTASFSPAGSDEWVQARINRPIWVGDRLWTGDGRIELQIGGASLRLAPRTSLQILNFDDRIAQFEVTQGSVALHVRRIDRDETIEIDTPSFAFVTHEEGDYRIDVEHDMTAVSARRGFADIYGPSVAYRIDRRERFAFYSEDLRDYDAGPLPPPDAFDRWARERAVREDRSISARYVSPELVGFVDLDNHGEWRVDATYGNVWLPRVDAGWAPYRYGNWTWVDPWGWTWVDDAPWGFAPSHYGRWTQIGRAWAWVPGPRDVRPVYAPALVAWVGGDNFSLTVASGSSRGVGWFPLAPGEVWRPSYDVSRDYFTRVNVTNTVVNNTTVINVYNNRNDVRISNVDYRFHAAPAAVTAVPVETFVQGRPVQSTQARLNASAAAQANVLTSAPAQPVVQSFIGAAPRAQARPPAEAVQRQVVARTAPLAVPSIEQRAAMVREGKPVNREALERTAPQTAQPAAPQRPSTASPATGQPPAAQAPAAQAPVTAVPPGQQRVNVRVVDADKAAPKPLPPPAEGRGRAARNEAEKGRPAPGATPQPAQQAAQPQPAQAVPSTPPAQAAQPGQPPQAAQPGQPPQAAQPGRPQVATPQVEGAPPASATVRGATPPGQPTQAAPPARGGPIERADRPDRDDRGRAQRPERDSPARIERSERSDRPGRAEVSPSGAPAGAVAPSSPVQPREAAQPATPPAAIPTPAAPPAARAPGVDSPRAEQESRGRGEASGRRGAGGPPDERRAQPARAPAAAQETPRAPEPKGAESPAREARPVPQSAAPVQGARRPAEERRAQPASPTPAQPPASRAPETPQRPAAAPGAPPSQPAARPAAPAAQPASPAAGGGAEKKRQDRDADREREERERGKGARDKDEKGN